MLPCRPLHVCISPGFTCNLTRPFSTSPAKHSKKALSLPNPLRLLCPLIHRTMIFGQRWNGGTPIHGECRARHLASRSTSALGEQAQWGRLVISRLQTCVSFRDILDLITRCHLFGHGGWLFAGWYRSNVPTRLLL